MSTTTKRAAGGSRPKRAATKKRDISREEILTVSAELFAKNGFRATNLEQVADVFGVQRPAIYYYFKSKTEILAEIHTHLNGTMMEDLDRICEQDVSPREKLAQVVRSQVEFYSQNLHELGVIIENEQDLPADFKERAYVEKRRLVDALADIYREGVEVGEFRDIDPRAAVFAINGVVNWIYRWYRTDGPMKPAELADFLLEFAEHGYLAKPD